MVQLSKVSTHVRENSRWFDAVTRADGWIRDLLDRWMDNKSWEWDVKTDASGEPIYDLRLSVDEGSASERFDRFEIANEKVFTDRVYAAWGLALDEAISNRSNRSEALPSSTDSRRS